MWDGPRAGRWPRPRRRRGGVSSDTVGLLGPAGANGFDVRVGRLWWGMAAVRPPMPDPVERCQSEHGGAVAHTVMERAFEGVHGGTLTLHAEGGVPAGHHIRRTA
jgi:hypothetical protein